MEIGNRLIFNAIPVLHFPIMPDESGNRAMEICRIFSCFAETQALRLYCE